MAKTYLIRQERKFNGETTVASITYTCDEAQLQAIIAAMEGKITVLEENVTLSSPAEASPVITGGLVIDNISMIHSEAKTKYFGAYNKPIVFKSSTSVTELQNMFNLHTPFGEKFAGEKPDNSYPKMGNIGNL